MTDDLDKIKLSIDLIKEQWKRNIYVKWVAEIDKRRHAGECPKCGKRMWIQRGTGFRKTWMCDNCGLIVTKKDVADGQIWWDYIKLYALDEIERIKKAERRSQDVRNYKKDEI